MRNHNLWLISAALQAVILFVNAAEANWPGALGGLFGCFMCLIYWHEVSKRPEH